MSNRASGSSKTMAAKTPPTPTTTSSNTTHSATSLPHDKIAMRAYEKWCKRGRPTGTDKMDWLEAEAELRAELSRSAR